MKVLNMLHFPRLPVMVQVKRMAAFCFRSLAASWESFLSMCVCVCVFCAPPISQLHVKMNTIMEAKVQQQHLYL